MYHPVAVSVRANVAVNRVLFVPATGTYYVEVRSASNTGAYSLNVYRSNALPAALPPAAPSAGEDAFESEVATLLSAT